MISKPTAADVKSLTGSSASDAMVSELIDDAAVLAGKCLKGVSGDVQRAALKWLAAHLLVITGDNSSQIKTSESMGDASWSFSQGTLGEGLKATNYGRTALGMLPCLGAKTSGTIARVQAV